MPFGQWFGGRSADIWASSLRSSDRGRTVRTSAGVSIPMLSGAATAGFRFLGRLGAKQSTAACLKFGDGPAEGIDNITIESEFQLIGLRG